MADAGIGASRSKPSADAGTHIPRSPRRHATDCVRLSFEQVVLEIEERSDGSFRVSDAGGANRNAFLHGCYTDQTLQSLRTAALSFGVETDGSEIYAIAPSDEWLPNAIMAVANASAHAAYRAGREKAARDMGSRVAAQVADAAPGRDQ